ncbi:MAG: hypothetical protein ACYCPF_17645 [Streptosporangiaceae bacterium]
MARAAVIGEPLAIEGYGLAGAVLCPAADPAAALAAWQSLPGDVVVALLTPAAAEWIGAEARSDRPEVLAVVLPEAGVPAPGDLP